MERVVKSIAKKIIRQLGIGIYMDTADYGAKKSNVRGFLWHAKMMGFQPAGIVIIESNLFNFQTMKVFEPSNMYVLFVQPTSLRHTNRIRRSFEKITFIQMDEKLNNFSILDFNEKEYTKAISHSDFGKLFTSLNMDRIDTQMVYINFAGVELDLFKKFKKLLSRSGILIVRVHLYSVNQSHSYLADMILYLRNFNFQLLDIFGGKSLFYFQKDNDYDTIDLIFKNSDVWT